MVLSELPKDELEGTLERLRRLYAAARRDYSEKRIQYEGLSRDLEALGESIRNLKGSMGIVERALGLTSEQIHLPEVSEVKVGKPKGASEAAMKIVAAKNESGGVTFDEILDSLHEAGHKVSREYMHTILNRKKNYQKKLVRENGKWFLTDKGKEELGIE